MSHSNDPSRNNLPNNLPNNILETFPLPVFTQTTFPSNNIFSSLMRARGHTLDLQWDHFLHSSFNELIPSNNQRTIIGSNIPINTMVNTQIPTLDHILQQSFIDSSQNRYKHIISKEGEKQIKREHYNPTVHKIHSCPITQNNFEAGQTIIMLPCGHIFEPEAINRWLHDEKANCPVCRYTLKSKEVQIETLDASGTFTQHNRRQAQPRPSISEGQRRLINSLNLIYQPLQNIHSDFSQILPPAPTRTPPPPPPADMPPSPTNMPPPPISLLPPPPPNMPPSPISQLPPPPPTNMPPPILPPSPLEIPWDGLESGAPISSQTYIQQLLSNEIDRAEEANLQQAIIASLVEMQMAQEKEADDDNDNDNDNDNDIIMEDADSEVSSQDGILPESCEDTTGPSANDEEISPD